MQPSAVSLIPPLLTLGLVFLTRNVILSLACGVGCASFIVSGLSVLMTPKLVVERIFKVLELGNLSSINSFLESDKLFLFMFLLVLGMVIAVIAESGEGYGYVEKLSQRLNSRAQAQFASIFLSVTLFIDDYLNALTTSSVMRVLTDKFRIPRIKLAFLTTAMAGPLCTLVPISSWAAAITMFLVEAGIKTGPESVILADPFVTLTVSIPFVFFSSFLILTAMYIVVFGVSYGVVAKHEHEAVEGDGNLFGGIHAPIGGLHADEGKVPENHSPINFFAPLIVLSSAIFATMLATGGFFTSGVGFIEALKGSKAEISLLCGALTSLLFTFALFFAQRKITIFEALKAIKDGVLMMKDSLVVLTLAWTLANFMIHDLGSGNYIAKLLMPLISREFLPLSVFVMSGVISFSIGSAWATMAVMFPMVIPMVPIFAGLPTPVAISAVGSIYPVIGAVISGAVFGSSLSPIADLLVITSRNTQVNHFDYVKAQMQYLLPVGVGAALSFGISGILHGVSYWTRLGLSVVPGLVTVFAFMALLSAIKSEKV